MPNFEPSLVHADRAAPTPDIRDRGLVAQEEGLVLHRIVDEQQRRLGARAKLGDELGARPPGLDR